MFVWKKRMSHMETHVDAVLERFLFRHKVLGVLMMFIGMPLFTLAAVCVSTAAIVLPMAMALGWI
ncbi:MAG: hypothetical protein MSB10_04110 [Clostridiales bacterium]|uniref:hypothetical protein n=1 Tax=Flavonifractor porci TaxID=3133422 RepID=UPI0030A2A17F|nr:hypothetical protein [Clostridiales bacterium]